VNFCGSIFCGVPNSAAGASLLETLDSPLPYFGFLRVWFLPNPARSASESGRRIGLSVFIWSEFVLLVLLSRDTTYSQTVDFL
jgi:hypothetical protein